eukprot:10316-Hanusia_phi.AAC.2
MRRDEMRDERRRDVRRSDERRRDEMRDERRRDVTRRDERRREKLGEERGAERRTRRSASSGCARQLTTGASWSLPRPPAALMALQAMSSLAELYDKGRILPRNATAAEVTSASPSAPERHAGVEEEGESGREQQEQPMTMRIGGSSRTREIQRRKRREVERKGAVVTTGISTS